MALKFWTADVSNLSKNEVKKRLWEELWLKADIASRGVTISNAALQNAQVGDKFVEQNLGGGRNHQLSIGVELPGCFFLPYGLKIPFTWNKSSPYVVDFVDGKHYLTLEDKNLVPIRYAPRPKYHNQKTSDGIPLKLIGPGDFYDRNMTVFYSNECCYIERDEDCHFCNINYDKDLYTEKYGPYWRTPKQIAETVKAGFSEGVADHVTVTGGVIAERRELEYYTDVGESIRELLGVEAFNGTATVAAPVDFDNIPKLKEAGFRTTAMNLELWDKDYYKAVCPGKARNSGGWDNWLKALEYAVEVFGWGRVRSNFVPGIEPKAKTLQGFEYLSDKGVVCNFTTWAPNVGSALEGHRCPEAGWYVDLATKLAEMWKKAGFTADIIHDASGAATLSYDIFRIENDYFDILGAAGIKQNQVA
ncbi:radical SAM protein [Treponema primitia]|uniref:radical SAM protein n=1 Tax=Treponema primitia TaxID=88058 RepID=UPI00397F86B6